MNIFVATGFCGKIGIRQQVSKKQGDIIMWNGWNFGAVY